MKLLYYTQNGVFIVKVEVFYGLELYTYSSDKNFHQLEQKQFLFVVSRKYLYIILFIYENYYHMAQNMFSMMQKIYSKFTWFGIICINIQIYRDIFYVCRKDCRKLV